MDDIIYFIIHIHLLLDFALWAQVKQALTSAKRILFLQLDRQQRDSIKNSGYHLDGLL